MKRPLFSAYVILIAAILISVYLSPLFLIAGLFCVCVLSAALFVSSKYKGYFAFTVFYILGAVLGNNVISHEKETCLAIGKEVEIYGTVIDTSLTKTDRQILILKAKNYIYEDFEYQWHEKVRIILGEDEFVNPGDEIKAIGIINHTETARNPGAYNEYISLGAANIYHKMYGLLDKDFKNFTSSVNIYAVPNGLKNKIAEIYEENLPERESGILKAMILGDNEDLDYYIEGLYKTGGIYHILVVSGLHISALAMFLNFVLQRFLGNRQAGIITILFLCAYCFFTGCGIASVRAVIMCACLIISGNIYRKTDIITSIAFAGMILLVYNPLFLFSIGYQYSFTAVFGIGFLSDDIYKFVVSRAKFKGTQSKNSAGVLSGSLAVTVFTLPVCLYHFNYVSTYGIIINMLVIPTVIIVVVSGFIMAAVGFIHITLAGFFASPVYFLLKFYETLCLGAESLPFSVITSKTPPVIVCLGYIAAVLLIRRFLKLKDKEKRLIPAFITVVSYILIFCAYLFSEKSFTITMLDVGQGDCAVIENNNEVYIIDGGGWLNRDLGENTGTGVIYPYLQHKGINKINGVFISHLDFDHAFGIIELLGLTEVENLYIPAVYDSLNPLYIQLIEAAKINDCKVNYLNKGDTLTSPDGIRFLILSPEKDKYYANENDSSMVIYMKKDISAIFTGDIGFDTENEIISGWADLKADILKVSHHGSKNATGEEFLNAVNPKTVIGGAGVNNLYSFPNPETIKRLERINSKIYFTNAKGAVIITKGPGGVEVKTMLE